MRECVYQAKVIRKLRRLFPQAIVMKNDANYIQGIPDIVIFVGERWAMLEVKPSKDAFEQPNQRYYVEKLDDMSFAAFIYPENEEEVFDELQRSLTPRRATRIPQR